MPIGLQAEDHIDFLPSVAPVHSDEQASAFLDSSDGISANQRIVGQRLLDRLLILTQSSVSLAPGDDK